MKRYFFPDYGISIEADSREDALAKVQSKKKEKKSKTSPSK